jgi:hypothetical protein
MLNLNGLLPIKIIIGDPMDQNHDFIDVLLELYDIDPEDEGQFAASRVAVIIERHIRLMYESGKTVTPDTLIESMKISLEKQKLSKAS